MTRTVAILGIAGGVGFWLANFAISLTPIAAEYRAALSISYLPMLIEALFGGLVVGFLVSYLLVRFFDRIPTRDPILKSVVMSVIALAAFTVVVEAPARFFDATTDSLHIFLIGVGINGLRFLALGAVIGYLYGRLTGA